MSERFGVGLCLAVLIAVFASSVAATEPPASEQRGIIHRTVDTRILRASPEWGEPVWKIDTTKTERQQLIQAYTKLAATVREIDKLANDAEEVQTKVENELLEGRESFRQMRIIQLRMSGKFFQLYVILTELEALICKDGAEKLNTFKGPLKTFKSDKPRNPGNPPPE